MMTQNLQEQARQILKAIMNSNIHAYIRIFVLKLGIGIFLSKVIQ